jgi:isopenicillin-N N-acyltransferase-like protein
VADLVASNRDLYFARFRQEWGLPRKTILERARAFEAVIDREAPEYAEMMEGVAEGSGVPLPEVVALNARYEIVYSEYSRRGRAAAPARIPSGCTALGLLPERTREGHLLIAQNWDWIPGVRPILLRIAMEGGPGVLAFSEAGIVGPKIGLNAACLGLAINGLVSDADTWDGAGLPFHVRCWRILRAPNLEDALRVIRTNPGPCSANFLLGHASNGRVRLFDVESSPKGTVLLEPEGGALVHANHFRRGGKLGISQPLLAERESTFLRDRRMRALVDRSRTRQLAMDEVAETLKDHEGHPNSICRHPDPALPPAERYGTLVSIVMDLHSRTLHISSGNPCAADYSRHAL